MSRIDDLLKTRPEPVGDSPPERRRGERPKSVSPALIPLLRDPAGIWIPEEIQPKMAQNHTRLIALAVVTLCLALGFVLRGIA